MRIGVLGLGRVARAHLEAIQNLSDRVILEAVCDVNEDRARSVGGEFQAKKVYTDYDSFFKDPNVEAVIICLPNHLHCESAVRAAEAGKHVLVEKPMAMNLAEARKMVEAAEKKEVALMVGQSRRFSRAIQEARKARTQIGGPFRLDVSFLVKFPAPATPWWTDKRKAGHLIILLQGSHSIDTVVWLLGTLPRKVFSVSKRINPAFGGEDESDILLEFDSGLASIHLSLNTEPYLHELVWVGDKGSLRLYEYPTNKVYGFSYKLEVNGEKVLEEEQIPSLYTNQLSEFIQAIEEKREPLASGREILKTMQVLDAVLESDAKGEPVTL
ncbi:oxidoreductase domain protein [Spirochaeta thermophila DSM 6578]|uniref:Oxidoreductase domain protein n=1 Tax=Winmispira thermophila (strain ATCC 700085 / DSM 6578 / Z-1203) TaxID=869211 RepID=G0GB99_WINT7|nr:Gfo/Idh/MocA family oxidoreductase [Spirochaeta thermophila]AEJ61908.1 oxidoreductase domain protein [Spirochaeta thermophila DSM 6578]